MNHAIFIFISKYDCFIYEFKIETYHVDKYLKKKLIFWKNVSFILLSKTFSFKIIFFPKGKNFQSFTFDVN